MNKDVNATSLKLMHSPEFARCRLAAEKIEHDRAAVLELLDEVAAHRFGAGKTLAQAGATVDVETARYTIENHLARGTDRSDPVEGACFRLLLAALLYVTIDDDVVPDSLPHGHLDDIAVIRWANRIAHGEHALLEPWT